jgi:multidrug resistance efflux pump
MSAKGHYDVKRQSRGAEPSAKPRSWRGGLVLTGLAVICVVAAIVAVFIWLQMTRVKTLSARVRASVIALSPVVDARLRQLDVSTGDAVVEGQVLGRLDGTELRAALEAVQATATLRKIATAAAHAHYKLTEAQLNVDVVAAQAGVDVVAAHVEYAKASIAARQARLTDEIRAAEARYNVAAAELRQLKKGPSPQAIAVRQARLEAAQAQEALCQLEVEQSEKLVTSGIDSEHLLKVRGTRLITQQKVVREAELNLEALRAGPTANEIDAAEQALVNLEAQHALAQTGRVDVDSLRAELAIRQAELAAANSRLSQAKAQSYRMTIAQQKINAAEAELKKAQADVTRAEAVLGSLEFISPIAGIVTRTYNDVGEVCRKGEPSILVADDSRGRWIEGFIRDSDAMNVQVGQSVRVRVPAGTGDYFDAEVEAVGMHTSSLDGEGAGTAAYLQGERVWIKIRTAQPLPEEAVTGTTANATIRIR